ncbi:restriction endonuclease subunit S [Fluviicola sp.]|uniref:restriction endonuclease subunit S n=1 Tax=Fluviicola sp. TaxID=1917219 RepID=UPI0031DB8E34
MEEPQPKLRFPEFEKFNNSAYVRYSFSEIFKFSTGKNIKQKEASPEFETPCVRYGELYHMYNEVIRKVINRTNIDKSELHFSEGDEIILPSAGEDPLDIGSASALTVKNVAIGRTINILKPLKYGVYSQVYVAYYINHKLKKRIAALAKGVSISNVYNSDLKSLDVLLPPLPEQIKIATLLSTIDEKINLLKEKKTTLGDYKKGMIQKIFSQEIRIKNENGEEFDPWQELRLNDLLVENKRRNNDNSYNEVFSIAKLKGVINQVEHLGRSYASDNISNYKVVYPNDLVYTKSPTSDFPYGIIKQNKLNRTGVVSVLYGVYTPKNKYVGALLHAYFEDWKNTYNYLDPIVQKGAKNTINIGNQKFLLGDEILFPVDIKEQTKIASFLSTIDEKIDLVSKQIDETTQYKKSLLQQMLV